MENSKVLKEVRRHTLDPLSAREVVAAVRSFRSQGAMQLQLQF
jgi:hypothetical protein